MQETWVQSLGWEDTLEKGTATYSSILALRIPWTLVACSSLMILPISVVSVVTSPFSFLILQIWVRSLFFLMNPVKGLSILIIFSKYQLLVSLIFAISFFISISLISSLIFMISFLLLTLDFAYASFSSCLGYKVSCLRFLLFAEVGLYCYKLSS